MSGKTNPYPGLKYRDELAAEVERSTSFWEDDLKEYFPWLWECHSIAVDIHSKIYDMGTPNRNPEAHSAFSFLAAANHDFLCAIEAYTAGYLKLPACAVRTAAESTLMALGVWKDPSLAQKFREKDHTAKDLATKGKKISPELNQIMDNMEQELVHESARYLSRGGRLNSHLVGLPIQGHWREARFGIMRDMMRLGVQICTSTELIFFDAFSVHQFLKLENGTYTSVETAYSKIIDALESKRKFAGTSKSST